jgi:predicted peroxiredoxin
MMLASSTSIDQTFLLIGLSRENVARLVAGLPIALNRSSHGDAVPAGLTIFITYGATEMAMKAELEKLNVITKDTKVTVDPRLK